MTKPHSTVRKTLRVTVLRGGPGLEREISLASGRAVADALRRRGHDVFEADVSPADLSALDHDADVVFPALHGEFGEDGTLQRILEERRIRFVGSGSAASALAMDKVAAKRRATELGFATAEYRDWSEVDEKAAPPFPGPWVVKPADRGSSVLTFIFDDSARFASAVQEVIAGCGRALVEKFIAGEELTVGIIGGEALPPICIRPKRRFYDYEAKYLADDTEYVFDAGHPQRLLETVQAQSRRVFAEFGCRHMARADWIADRNGKLWFLELNTIPGFTGHSLVPKAAAHVGVPFDELVERLVLLAWTEQS